MSAACLALLLCAGRAFAADATSDPLTWPQGCDNAAPSAADEAKVRIPDMPRDGMDAEQQRAAQAIASGPRGCIFGPFSMLVRSPELLTRTQQLGEYLRFHSMLPMKLREFSMLYTGRAFQNQYVWYIHEPIALRAGVEPTVIRDMAAGRRPAQMDADEIAIYDFLHELAERHAVGDQAYERIHSRFGDKGTLDLVGIFSYFSLLALEMNVARTPVPSGVDIPFKQVQ